ncbi:hypothetical protein CBM2626_B10127 [Cupriavidus taiwanensis]|uniref:Uncharacterized protein n=1 Tax=Cupriavidus taiwanensis TaxID=164546 RepID=A0A976G417_9BURK|nr:hypothetical protein CBM2615_B10343 [Cupriavidus taiwanensis]SOZ62452.1 hypothetical protein CBM2614_B10251 [Cupriavidus taiwanensis]SOZ66558.1 hypothetical protein CBM2613_B10344 [Cupriavidus taiwanensis]SPA00928.1 hypothetical protein CBM2626_B10127 [Cupriavidus taiwanensis]SPA07651.1 hypothetical protein CBM2625_B10346 [Cupriavidus taiwanensis]
MPIILCAMAQDAQALGQPLLHMLQSAGIRPGKSWRKAPVGDYPLQRTITLHSLGAFHMLQVRSYKYLDQTSAESKALATEAFHTHTGAIRYLQGKDDLQPDGKAVRQARSTGGS